MKIEKLHKKIVEASIKYKELMEPLIKEFVQYDGISVKIPHGQYKGRWGKITNVTFFNGAPKALVQPYRLIGGGGETLTDTTDARTYWSLIDVKEIKEN